RMADQVLRRDRDDATVSQFHTAADGVATIDTTGLGIDDVVVAILALVDAAEAEAAEADAPEADGATAGPVPRAPEPSAATPPSRTPCAPGWTPMTWMRRIWRCSTGTTGTTSSPSPLATCRWWPSSVVPTSASPPWSTASWDAARPWSRAPPG